MVCGCFDVFSLFLVNPNFFGLCVKHNLFKWTTIGRFICFIVKLLSQMYATLFPTDIERYVPIERSKSEKKEKRNSISLQSQFRIG